MQQAKLQNCHLFLKRVLSLCTRVYLIFWLHNSEKLFVHFAHISFKRKLGTFLGIPPLSIELQTSCSMYTDITAFDKSSIRPILDAVCMRSFPIFSFYVAPTKSASISWMEIPNQGYASLHRLLDCNPTNSSTQLHMNFKIQPAWSQALPSQP